MRIPHHLLLALAAGCTGAPPPTPTRSTAPAVTGRAPAGSPPVLLLGDRERAEETAWLTSFGLEVPPGGILLREPFARPLSRRSFIVPTAWYRADDPTTVVAADLAADLELLAVAFPKVYGGYERARARGLDFDDWLARWRARLTAAGHARLPAAEAFAPVRELMAVQLDNHTGPALTPYVRFGSGSRTALLRAMPSAPCTAMRTADGASFQLDPEDRAQQPRETSRYDGGRQRAAPHLVYPAARGQLAAVQCGARWIEALPPEPASEDERMADMLGLLDRRDPDDDAPAYRALAPDVGYLRLPTFSMKAGEELRALAGRLPAGAGRERAVIVDLRFNDGGAGASAFPVLSRWVDVDALGRVQVARSEKQSCLVSSLQWGLSQQMMQTMKPPISAELRAVLQGMLDELTRPAPAGCPVTTTRTERTWAYDERRFRPAANRPVLLVLVNDACGSDCEYIAMLLASRPEAVIAGVNTFGVAQFVQPAYMILPRTRVTFRMARGMSEAYGDGRSFDGYGLDPDILLTSRAAHARPALLRLARRLARERALR